MDISSVNTSRVQQSQERGVVREDLQAHERHPAGMASRISGLDPHDKSSSVLPVSSQLDDAVKSAAHRTDDLRESLSTKRKADDDHAQSWDRSESFSHRYDHGFEKRARSERTDDDRTSGSRYRSYERDHVRGGDYGRDDRTSGSRYHSYERDHVRGGDYYSRSGETSRADSRHQQAARFEKPSRPPEVKAVAAQAQLPRDYEALIKHPETIKPDHTITIQSRPEAPYMTYLRTGEKTAECRVNGRMYQNLREGNIILFHNRQEGIFCKIIFLHKYKTFKEMIETEGATNLLPQLKKLKLSEADLMQRAIKTYEGFPGSHNVVQWGSIAIGVKYLCDKPRQG